MSGIHDGHRQRMDKKAKISGLYNLPQHEVLEIILFSVIPRGNTNEIAQKLIKRFGSIGGVILADEKELIEVEGVGLRTAKFLNSLYDILGIVERSLEFPKEQIKTSEEAILYAKTFFYGKLSEEFYMITLNKMGTIIGRYSFGSGNGEEVSVYPENIVAKATADKANAVIIAHNHPGGTLTPSFADIKMTEQIEKSLNAVGIKLFDSLILSGGKGISILHK